MGGMTIDLENFDFVKSRGEELYKSFEPVRCPYFDDLVYFTAEGLEHLKYKRHNRDRLKQDQYMRFKLLHLAPQILKLSRTVQGIMRINTVEHDRINHRWQSSVRASVFYEFIAVIDGVRVRIIVKCVEQGKNIFWSIIPLWKKGVFGRQLHDSDLSAL
jgi:hypothetical protein